MQCLFSWLGFVLIVLLATLLFINIRRRRKLQGQLNQMRASIAQDLHDEVGSTLSAMALYSRVVENQIDKSNIHKAALVHQIGQNADQALESISDIVWSISARYDDFGSLVTRMRVMASNVLETVSCALHFECEDQLMELNIQIEERKNLYLIFKEAINNIAKHSHCSNVWVQLSRDSKKTLMVIRDDGTGFNLDPARQTGNGLANMEMRARRLGGRLSIRSQLARGTELTLRIDR